jgi:hypothetical protein
MIRGGLVADHYVLMADVIASRKREPRELMREFQQLTATANKSHSAGILSPLTITLGDEFQGVVESLHDAVKVILELEESRLRGQFASKLRYVVLYGDIATPVNRNFAHGMMGAGLTRAREELSDKRLGRPRFIFELPNKLLGSQLSRLLEVMYALTRDWKPEDSGLLFDMLSTPNNEEVAERHGKNRSQVWKRRQNQFVDEYGSLRDIVLELSEGGLT